MNKIIIVAIVSIMVASFLLLSGCTSTSSLSPSPTGTSTPITTNLSLNPVGGRYNASIQIYQMSTSSGNVTDANIIYTKDNQTISGAYVDYSKTAYDYIIKNTLQDATFLCWWDYGDSIIGYTGRNTVVRRPSLAIANTMASIANAKTDSEKQQLIQKLEQNGVASNQTIIDVATALLTKDPQQTISIMNKFGAQYLLVTQSDTEKAFAMFAALNEPQTDTSSMILGQAVNGATINGLTKVYSGDGVNIYKIS